MPADPQTLRIPGAPQAAPRVFYRSLVEFLRDLPGTAKRFWVLVILTGASAGLGAVLLLHILRWVQRLAWPPADTFLGAVVGATTLRRVAVTTCAGVLVTGVSLLVRQPLKGHGTAGVIESIWVRSGRFPLGRALLRGAVSIVAVALGAPLGREGALIQTGAATGSWLGARFRVPADQARLLVACGAAAGIAAAYNVPIGASVFGLEVLLGSFALELFGPIVVCCVIATLISRILIADHPSYIIPHYQLTGPRELLLFLAIGPVLGLASALFIRVIDSLSNVSERVPKRFAAFVPILAALAVGICALRLPELLGNGYDSVNQELLGQLPLVLLVVLPLVKLGATALCAGSGIPGGLFTPSLFYGAMLGGALGHLAHFVLPAAAPPGAYALVGMAAVLAGTTQAPVSAVLIIFELTGDYDAILPLMLACVLAAAVCRWVQPHSLYTAVLRHRNVQLPEAPRPDWLKATRVRQLTRADAERIPATAPLEEVVLKLLALPAGHDLYVTHGDGRLAGVVQLDALKGHLPDHSLLTGVIAADVMDTQVKPVTADMSVSEVALRFADTTMERLPVVEPKTGKLVGTVAKNDVLRRGRF